MDLPEAAKIVNTQLKQYDPSVSVGVGQDDIHVYSKKKLPAVKLDIPETITVKYHITGQIKPA